MLSLCSATSTGSTSAAVSAVRVVGCASGCATSGFAASDFADSGFEGASGSAASPDVLAGASSPAASITATTPPSDRLSPTLTLRSLHTPANGDGTSILPLSDPSVTSPLPFFHRKNSG